MLGSTGEDQKPRRRRVKPDGFVPDDAGMCAAAEAGSKVPTSAPGLPPVVAGPTVGGLMRPWMLAGPALQSRTLVEDAGVVLWEGGEKTTTEIKREIVDLLDRTDSLVALVDMKAAERPDEPRWWPSLTTVMTWMSEDPFFAKAIETWSHARQARLLERVVWDLNGPDAAKITKAEFALLKERVKFASSVLPRIVNRGLREKVDIETTQNHLHLHANLSEQALEEKLEALRRNPLVREFLAVPNLGDGATVEGQILPPAIAPAAEPLPFRDPGTLGQDLLAPLDGGGS